MPKDGRFTACLHNHGRHKTEATLHLLVNHKSADYGQLRSAHLAPLNTNVAGLKRVLDLLLEEQYYQEKRDEMHRETNESTAYRTVVKAVVEWVALLFISVTQVVLLKRMFSEGRPIIMGGRRMGDSSPRSAGLLGI